MSVAFPSRPPRRRLIRSVTALLCALWLSLLVAREGAMRFAIAIPTDANSWRVVRRAEELGFSRAWFYDTQMLSADPFVAMAAAAMKTTKIRLGTGVLIPSNRIARGRGQRLCLAQQAGAGTDRFRRRHRLHRAPGDGARRGQARRHGSLYPYRHGAVARGDGRSRDRGQAPPDPPAQPRARPDQHQGPDRALRRRVRSAGAGS